MHRKVVLVKVWYLPSPTYHFLSSSLSCKVVCPRDKMSLWMPLHFSLFLLPEWDSWENSDFFEDHCLNNLIAKQFVHKWLFKYLHSCWGGYYTALKNILFYSFYKQSTVLLLSPPPSPYHLLPTHTYPLLRKGEASNPGTFSSGKIMHSLPNQDWARHSTIWNGSFSEFLGFFF